MAAVLAVALLSCVSRPQGRGASTLPKRSAATIPPASRCGPEPGALAFPHGSRDYCALADRHPDIVLAVLDNGSSPTDMVVRHDYLYWLDAPERAPGELDRVPVYGGTVETLATGLEHPAALAADDQHAYVAEPDAPQIERVALRGGARKVVATGQRPLDVALDLGFVYWTDDLAGTIERAPLGGGSTEIVARDQDHPSHIAVDRDFVYWTTRGEGEIDGAVVRACKDGRFPQYLGLDQSRPTVIQARGGVAFWINSGDRQWHSFDGLQVFRIKRSTDTPAGPGEPETLAEATADNALAVDSSEVFFAHNGGIQYVAVDGGEPRQFSWGVPDGAIALDDCNVYFATDTKDGQTRIVKRWK